MSKSVNCSSSREVFNENMINVDHDKLNILFLNIFILGLHEIEKAIMPVS